MRHHAQEETLRARLGVLVDAARAILNRAHGEGRKRTPEEDTELRRLDEEMDAIEAALTEQHGASRRGGRMMKELLMALVQAGEDLQEYDAESLASELPTSKSLAIRSERSLRGSIQLRCDVTEMLVERAKRDNRSLSVDEGSLVKKLEADVAQLEAALAMQRRSGDESVGRRLFAEMSRAAGQRAGDEPEGTVWRDRETGQEVRSFSRARGERLADAFPTSGEPLHLGRIIRAAATGDRRGLTGAEERAIQIGAATGSYLIPEIHGTTIPLIEAGSVFLGAGADVFAMSEGVVKLARDLTRPATSWPGELEEIPLTDPTFGLLEMRAHPVAVRVLCSVPWFEDAVNGPEMLQRAVTGAIGQEIDRAVAFGVGGLPGVAGVANVWGINEVSMGQDGAEFTSYLQLVEAITKILERNGPSEGLVAVMAPRTWGELQSLLDTNDGQPLRMPSSVAALTQRTSSKFPIDQVHGNATDASTLLLGRLDAVLIGIRTAMTIEISRTAGDAWSKLGVEVRCYARLDWTVTQPGLLTAIRGIIPPSA